jgi:hypothetical protein
VQEGRGDEVLLLARSDSLGWIVGDGQWRLMQQPVWSRAARSAAKWWEGKSEVGDGFLGDVQSSGKGGPTHVGSDDRRPQAPSTLRAVSTATRNRGGAQDWATVLSGQTETGR